MQPIITRIPRCRASFAKVSAALSELPNKGAPGLYLGNVVLPADLEALKRGAALARKYKGNLHLLEPKHWPAPPQKNLDDKESRAVMLAWVLGKIGIEAVGTTNKAFEALAKKVKGLEHTSYQNAIAPKKGDLEGLAVPVGDALKQARAEGLRMLSGGSSYRGVDTNDLIILHEPEVFARAFAEEMNIKWEGTK